MYLNTYRLPCMRHATDKNILQNYIKSTSIVLRFIIFYVFITFHSGNEMPETVCDKRQKEGEDVPEATKYPDKNKNNHFFNLRTKQKTLYPFVQGTTIRKRRTHIY